MKLHEVKDYFHQRFMCFTIKQTEILEFYFEKKSDVSEKIANLIFKNYAYKNEDDVMFYPSNFYWKFLEMIGTKGEDYLKLEITKKYMEQLENDNR